MTQKTQDPKMQKVVETFVLKWNRLACDAIYHAKMPITIATRALCMVHTAMYDAWTAYTSGPEASTTSGVRFKKPDHECTYQNREKAYSYAAYRALEHLFHDRLPEEHRDMFADCMRELDYDPDDTTQNPRTAAGIGNLAAKLVIDCRKGDGSNEEHDYADYTEYEPVNAPPPKRPLHQVDRWQPQLDDRRKAQVFLTPHWGLVTPFALESGSACRPPAPVWCDSDHFNRQLDAVKHISACLDDEQKLKAEFWAGMHEDKFDGISVTEDYDYWTILPVQCCRIVQYLIEENEFQNANAIRLFFALTNALFDATIAVWDAKCHYDYARPESIIHEVDDNNDIESWGGPGQGTVSMQGEGWCPYLLSSPPYAEYVSAHSALAWTMAVIVTRYCGTSEYGKSVTFPKGSSVIEPDCTPEEEIVLCWDTLHHAAEDAGRSRLYAGTNFRSSHREGRELGKEVARRVWSKVLFYFDGC